jgi:late competence protein required for DNA uptake (superfamily II DNA/RNA helicase)
MNELEAFFTGRIWLKDFTPFPEEQIEHAIAKGDFLVIKGITADGQCSRCLEKSPHKILSYNCAKCGSICFYCRHCIQMGRISSCTELISWDRLGRMVFIHVRAVRFRYGLLFLLHVKVFLNLEGIMARSSIG